MRLQRKRLVLKRNELNSLIWLGNGLMKTLRSNQNTALHCFVWNKRYTQQQTVFYKQWVSTENWKNWYISDNHLAQNLSLSIPTPFSCSLFCLKLHNCFDYQSYICQFFQFSIKNPLFLKYHLLLSVPFVPHEAAQGSLVACCAKFFRGHCQAG